MSRAVALSLALSLVALPSLGAEVATVAAMRGEATVIQDGRPLAVAVGMAIATGAVIQTRASGRVKLKFIDGSVVIVGDDSTFRVDRMSVDSDGRRRDAGFVLDIGLISQSVAPSSGGTWRLRTPTAVTAVRGTEYVVEVRSNRSTQVDIRSGEVLVEPVERPGGLRQLGGAPPGPPAAPVVLGGAPLGTQCDSQTFACSPAAPSSASRLQAISDRLSGL